jgi:hypothetical protein
VDFTGDKSGGNVFLDLTKTKLEVSWNITGCHGVSPGKAGNNHHEKLGYNGTTTIFPAKHWIQL